LAIIDCISVLDNKVAHNAAGACLRGNLVSLLSLFVAPASS